MALIKEITLDNGAVVKYHKVQMITLANYGSNKTIEFGVAHFANKEVREEKNIPIKTTHYNMPVDKMGIDLSANIFSGVYDYLKNAEVEDNNIYGEHLDLTGAEDDDSDN